MWAYLYVSFRLYNLTYCRITVIPLRLVNYFLIDPTCVCCMLHDSDYLSHLLQRNKSVSSIITNTKIQTDTRSSSALCNINEVKWKNKREKKRKRIIFYIISRVNGISFSILENENSISIFSSILYQSFIIPCILQTIQFFSYCLIYPLHIIFTLFRDFVILKIR